MVYLYGKTVFVLQRTLGNNSSIHKKNKNKNVMHTKPPADTRRNKDVIMTLKRRHDVVVTS